ncbi:MAG: AAA family ATPase, partial [Deltaproteobacteria bacterium]|nr:AAA family ATPase [Deltaproteobacteria bacterium]
DCIEFNERFRYSDTVADIAFLAMDLDFFNSHNLSQRFIHTYIDASKDSDVLGLLDFYKCYRAYIRGKVEGFKSLQKEVPEKEREVAIIKAKRYFYLSDLYATGGFRPIVLVVCGLTGTGKTTIANAISEEIGFKVISSDIVRKELAGISPREKRYEEFEKGIYTRDFTIKTYHEMMKRGEFFLKHGISVILDATFMADKFRQMAVKLAKDTNANLYFIECVLDAAVVKQRLDERLKKEGISSDGRWEIYLKQKEQYESILPPPFLKGGDAGKGERYFKIDTSSDVDKLKKLSLYKAFE